MPMWNKKRAHRLVTGPWMEKVRAGIYWCPRISEFRLSACVEPPEKPLCFEEVRRAIREQNNNFGLKNREQLDKEYLLTILATLEPDHPWFGVGWTRRAQHE